MQINRSLEDKAMDRIDHALGRPLDPMGETYRNFYAVDGAEADEMEASPHWIEGSRYQHHLRMRCFAVTDEGRKALAVHLKEINDPHRAYVVTYRGHDSTVIAKSHSKARYDYYLRIRDVCPDLTFDEYCRQASARLANGKGRR